jgi:hypothetical protein
VSARQRIDLSDLLRFSISDAFGVSRAIHPTVTTLTDSPSPEVAVFRAMMSRVPALRSVSLLQLDVAAQVLTRFFVIGQWPEEVDRLGFERFNSLHLAQLRDALDLLGKSHDDVAEYTGVFVSARDALAVVLELFGRKHPEVFAAGVQHRYAVKFLAQFFEPNRTEPTEDAILFFTGIAGLTAHFVEQLANRYMVGTN